DACRPMTVSGRAPRRSWPGFPALQAAPDAPRAPGDRVLRTDKPVWLHQGSVRPPVAESTFYQLQTSTVLLLLLAFYGGTFLMSRRIALKDESVDGYMNSNGAVGYGISAASMTATWIWAASFYA